MSFTTSIQRYDSNVILILLQHRRDQWEVNAKINNGNQKKDIVNLEPSKYVAIKKCIACPEPHQHRHKALISVSKIS